MLKGEQDLFLVLLVAVKQFFSMPLSKQAEADMVVVAACGESANEVVEIFTEFPELKDATNRKKSDGTNNNYCKYLKYAGCCP